MLHIESRRSRKHSSEFDIYADMELYNDVTVDSIMSELADRVHNFVVHDSSGGISMNKTISLDVGDTVCEYFRTGCALLFLIYTDICIGEELNPELGH